MPAHNEEAHVGGVIATMPDYVDAIVVVDDGSTDATAAAIAKADDPRVTLITHDPNQGLGASLIDAHKKALELGGDVMVVMAGDGQMDPDYLPALLKPILEEGFDFSKGNRFFGSGSWEGMPGYRVFGNVVLTFITKVATGYWDMFDPQNGYTAMTRRASEAVVWERVARDYSFENDVLAELGVNRMRVKDVDIPAVYGAEVSGIKLHRVVPSLMRTLWKAFWRRFWLLYVVRSFSPVALFAFASFGLLLWSFFFGIWIVVQRIGGLSPTTGTVMLFVLPFLVGFQLLLASFVLDIINTPK